MNIVVGNDGRSHSEKAAEYAFALAKALQANLYMLYIVSPKAQEEKEKNIKNGMRVLGRAKILASDIGVPLATLLEAGEVHETLLLAADKLKADALVIGSPTERTGMAKLLGASTSEAVIKNAPCTVVLVR
ncbi:MAG: universal stress protein [Methanomassiliicoccus sp.]|nr:universal stress protein [Methanomassiliicoccus sp.]